MAKIDKTVTIGELLMVDTGIANLLMGAGMHCVGCPSSAMETLEEAAMVHGLNADELVEDINNYLEYKAV